MKIESVRVLDVVGKEILRVSSINSLQMTLDVEFLYPEIYMLKITMEDGMQETKKFIKHCV